MRRRARKGKSSSTTCVEVVPARYVIVSNSTVADQYGGVENLKSKKSDLPNYASEKGVNVSHLRVTKDSYGNFYVEGDFLGSPVNSATWLADVVKDHKIPFEVECQPED